VEHGKSQVLSVKIFRFDAFLLNNMMMLFFSLKGFLTWSSSDKFILRRWCISLFVDLLDVAHGKST